MKLKITDADGDDTQANTPDDIEPILAKPMPRCPCCGKEWPPGMKPLTYGEYFAALGKAVDELGDPIDGHSFMALHRRMAAIARESHLRDCEILAEPKP